MLSSLVKDHQTKQAIKKEELGKKDTHFDFNWNSFGSFANQFSEHHRKEAVAASSELTQALVDHLNVG